MRMPSISALSLRIPMQNPTLLGLDLPLTTLIDITKKRKQQLSCTQETTRAKLGNYVQQDLSMVIKRSPLDLQRL
jgi:hypothetical protein